MQVHADVLDANMSVARHRAAAAFEGKRQRLAASPTGSRALPSAAAAPAAAAQPAAAAGDQQAEAQLEDALLSAQAQVQDMLRAMARVHSGARLLSTRVSSVTAVAAQLVADARLAGVKEIANENSCPLIFLLLAHADIREPMLRTLSLRRLWLLRRVCRAFRTLGTSALEATPRPIVGGWVQSGEEAGRALEVLNVATMRWEQLAPLEQALRSAGVCCRTGGRLVVAGGSKRKNPDGPSVALTRIDECWEYDRNSKQWSELPKLKTPRSACRLVGCPDGRVLVFGGAGRARKLLDSVEMLAMGAKEWVDLAPMHRCVSY